MALKTGFSTVKKLKVGRGVFRKVQDGETIEFIPLVEEDNFTHCNMHEFWDIRPAVFSVCSEDEECPGCQLENDARFRGYLPAMLRDGNVIVLVLPYKATQNFIKQAKMIGGSVRGMVMKVNREGTSFATTYTFITTGKTAAIPDSIVMPDLEKLLGPFDRHEILSVYLEGGLDISSVMKEGEKTPKKSDDDGWSSI